MRRLLSVFVGLLLPTVALAVGDEDLNHIQEVIEAAVNSNQVPDLQGRTFLIQAPPGYALETLEPAGAFQVSELGSSRYQVQIVDAGLLSEDVGVAVRAVRLRWYFGKSGAGETSTVTGGAASCTFEVVFYRADGKPVPLNLPAYEYRFDYDRQKLQQEQALSDTIRFTRQVDDVSVETVRFTAIHRETGEVTASGQAEVPYCASTPPPRPTPPKPPPPPPPRDRTLSRAEVGVITGLEGGLSLARRPRWTLGVRAGLSGYLSADGLGAAMVLGPAVEWSWAQRAWLRGSVLGGPTFSGGPAVLVPLEVGLDLPLKQHPARWSVGGGVLVGAGWAGGLIAPTLTTGYRF